MQQEEFLDLLARSESGSIDWKADFPPGLIHHTKGSKEWDKGRGTILKDAVSIANCDEPGPEHLIYGVEDAAAIRSVIGISKQWDDATFQTWAQNAFDPPPRFVYSEIVLADGKRVGVFVIERTTDGAHVACQTIGGVLFDGQVWFRQGTNRPVI